MDWFVAFFEDVMVKKRKQCSCIFSNPTSERGPGIASFNSLNDSSSMWTLDNEPESSAFQEQPQCYNSNIFAILADC